MKKYLQAMDGVSISKKKAFYVLKELTVGHENRAVGKEILKALPVDAIRKKELHHLSQETIYLNVHGEYFPDLIEESGIYLASEKLIDYLKAKIVPWNIQYNRVILAGEEGKRPEIYYLLIPDEVDCVLQDSARYKREGILEFMEIDASRIGKQPIFKIKGFPHLIITTKVNRNAFAGVKCTSIENYFHYEEKWDQLYRKRASGRYLQEKIDVFERMADAIGDSHFKYSLRHLVDSETLGKEIHQGLERVFSDYFGRQAVVEFPSNRLLVLFWSWENLRFRLIRDTEDKNIAIKSFEPVKSFIDQLPPELAEAARKVCNETLLYLACQESKILDQYSASYGGKRLRLYIQEEKYQGMDPQLIYDYKEPLRRQVEAAVSLKGMALSDADLCEFDFSGKTLVGLKIKDSDLRGAKFVNSVLNRVNFINCDLTGVDFSKGSLWKAKFTGCCLERAVFDGADLQQAEFCDSYLMDCSFIQSNLTAAQFSGHIMTDCLFHKADLGDVKFEITDALLDNGFRLCNLQKAKFIGKTEETELTSCEFRNCDLTEACFEVSRIVDSVFLKSKLNMADFSSCESISDCDFRWTSCFRMNIEGVWVESSDFSYGNLSQLKKMSGTFFCNNCFLAANLSGYDFGGCDGRCPNMLKEADLSYAKLDGVDLSSSNVIRADFSGAHLQGTIFHSRQLKDIKLSASQRGEIKVSRETPGEDESDPKSGSTSKDTET